LKKRSSIVSRELEINDDKKAFRDKRISNSYDKKNEIHYFLLNDLLKKFPLPISVDDSHIFVR
jgi:hypothetical protein